jgi:hypothetical protein
MRKPIVLKKVTLITIAAKNNTEKSVGFIRIDTRELLNQNQIEMINDLTNKHPQENFTYTLHCLENNCFYMEDEQGNLIKVSSSKKENLGKRKIIIKMMENNFDVMVELHKINSRNKTT